MTAEIIDFDRFHGRISPAMHNRRVQRPDGLAGIRASLEAHPSAQAKAREPSPYRTCSAADWTSHLRWRAPIGAPWPRWRTFADCCKTWR